MLEFPFEQAPSRGEVTEVKPGILWARLPLPFRLDHVNIYLLEDFDGWYILDAGIDYAESKAHWLELLSGPLKDFSFKGLIVTHHHPDHIGLAGWLCDMLKIPLLTSRTSFLSCMTFTQSPALLEAEEYRQYFSSHGMTPEIAAIVAIQGHEYLGMLSPPPKTFQRLASGDVISIGTRKFEILAGEGHCTEQLMLHCREDNVFLAADQVIEKITPNVSVTPFEPHGDPLGDYLQSLRMLRDKVPAETLVLSGHRLPFIGIAERCTELLAHHDQKIELITKAVEECPRSANELVSILYPKVVMPHELSFAFSEVLSHLNYMVKHKMLLWELRQDVVFACPSPRD